MGTLLVGSSHKLRHCDVKLYHRSGWDMEAVLSVTFQRSWVCQAWKYGRQSWSGTSLFPNDFVVLHSRMTEKTVKSKNKTSRRSLGSSSVSNGSTLKKSSTSLVLKWCTFGDRKRMFLFKRAYNWKLIWIVCSDQSVLCSRPSSTKVLVSCLSENVQTARRIYCS